MYSKSCLPKPASTVNFLILWTLTHLVASNERTCAVAAAAIKEVRLLANLSPHAKPIATKSWRFSCEHPVFTREAIEKLLINGVIRPSASP